MEEIDEICKIEVKYLERSWEDDVKEEEKFGGTTHIFVNVISPISLWFCHLFTSLEVLNPSSLSIYHLSFRLRIA